MREAKQLIDAESFFLDLEKQAQGYPVQLFRITDADNRIIGLYIIDTVAPCRQTNHSSHGAASGCEVSVEERAQLFEVFGDK